MLKPWKSNLRMQNQIEKHKLEWLTNHKLTKLNCCKTYIAKMIQKRIGELYGDNKPSITRYGTSSSKTR